MEMTITTAEYRQLIMAQERLRLITELAEDEMKQRPEFATMECNLIIRIAKGVTE